MVKILLNMELLYLIMVARGEPRLVILRSINNTKIEVQSMISTTQGDDLVLMCNITSSESGERLDNEVKWSKNANKNYGEKKSPNLRFTPVMLEDGGIYLCTSLKYNLSKPAYVTVRMEEMRKRLLMNIQRQKRAEFSNDWGGINYNSTHSTQLEISRVATERATTAKVRYNRSFNVDKNLNRSFYKSESSRTIVNSFGPLLYIVAIAAFSLIIFILYVAYQQAKNVEDLPVTVSSTCAHPVCVRFRSTHASHGCLLETVISDNHRNDRIVSVSTFVNPLIEANNYSQMDHLDLPPSYGTSIRCDLPPTYDEAVATILTDYRLATSSPLMACIDSGVN